MPRLFDRPIVIQKQNESTEEWENVFAVHASINKSKSNDEYLSGGAIQAKESLVFEVRYFKALEDVRLNTQIYRVLYSDVPYNIEDYDDYMLRHKTVKLLGVSY